jgi:hypothetical protein
LVEVGNALARTLDMAKYRLRGAPTVRAHAAQVRHTNDADEITFAKASASRIERGKRISKLLVHKCT